jgi:hypothetical protein
VNVRTDEAAKHRNKDFEDFLEFSKKMFTKYYDSIRKFDFLNVALASHFRTGTIALEYSNTSSFVDACISLEALYNESQGDLRYKISHRLAFILGFDGFQSIYSFHNAKKIYDKRSEILHGGGGGGKPDRLYVEQTRSYARRSCICFLILCRNHTGQQSIKVKREVLREIDEAMLDLDKREALRTKIAEGMKDFALKILRDESEYRNVCLPSPNAPKKATPK